MVNNESPRKSSSTKTRILHLLKTAEGRLSGSAISRDLGVSRVAVWKAVQALQEKGVPIEADKQGYLLNDPTVLDLENIHFPGELYFYNTTGSTMDDSRHLKNRGKGDFLVIADEQSRGVGRNRRLWDSPRGGIFMTLSKEISIPLACCPAVSMEILFRTAEYFRDEWGIPVLVKWPNDLYLQGRKLAGLLLELEASGDRTSRIALGLGVNVNNSGSRESISLKEYSGSEWDREELISRLAEIQETALNDAVQSRFSEWDSSLLAAGKAELVRFNRRALMGEIEGIDPQGRLIFRDENSLTTLSPGECEKLRLLTNKKDGNNG